MQNKLPANKSENSALISPRSRHAAAQDIAVCRNMLRENSRTFFAASLLLPRSVREPASALYAFCRLADDAVDLQAVNTTANKQDVVAMLRERLELAYLGRPVNVAADRAFADVIARFGIPRALPDALLEGFEWDASGRRYENIGDVYAYSARVAGTVGAMMSVLMGATTATAAARACDLGVAMQLSNICRDVGEDAQAGRLYLPMQWMTEAGIDSEAWLAKPLFTPALGTVIQRVLHAADTLYGQVGLGVAELPKACQPGINAARFLYAEIGREVERAHCDSVSRRAVVPASRKAQLLSRALVTPAKLDITHSPLPLAETRFLVDAVVTTPPPLPPIDIVEPVPSELPWWNLADRAAWLIDLFEKLERREKEETQSAVNR